MNERIEDNAINPNNNQNKTNTFNLVIGIATLLIAILGATFAYFSATARSAENDVTVKSAYVSISYEGGTEIKATNLIPATQTVAMNKYQKDVAPYNPEVDGEIITDYDSYSDLEQVDRKCVDAKGKEVCYVYQFSIESDGEVGGKTPILASLKINHNQFENLSYMMYEVEFEEENGEVITDKYGFGIVNKYTVVGEFDIIDQNPDNVDFQDSKFAFAQFSESPIDITGENEELVETMYPVACLFGYEEESDPPLRLDDTARCKPYLIDNKVKHTYQLVIWLEETGDVQAEQGMTFAGTVSIEVSGGVDTGEYEDGRITGTN